ncbi:hypothetical protein ACN42_g7871 [Penicillium freii]|uniref:Uncharacterized protein n=1 Tax=Penicillium freii TaxID=48697 RepID=A0A101MES7_PENFR|nr:hypothetical protein ACN42_g7871 [Penicillium freii]
MQGDRCMRETGRHVLRGYFDRTSRQDGNATSIQAQCGVGVQPGGVICSRGGMKADQGQKDKTETPRIYSKSNEKGYR